MLINQISQSTRGSVKTAHMPHSDNYLKIHSVFLEFKWQVNKFF